MTCMAKKKLYSPESELKLADALMGNYAGRLGGLVTLDRDIQLQLRQQALDKASYWRNKFMPFHNLNVDVSNLLATNGVPLAQRGVAMGLARAIAKCWAKYDTDNAELCEQTYYNQLTTVLGDVNLANEILDTARKYGLAATMLYHLAPPSVRGQ